jgi:AcrR family transcriptional regulator
VEACVQLVKAGDIRPTAPRIAEQAGVSVRSVFQHFDDLETLFSMVTLRSFDGLGALIRPISLDLPLDARIDALVSQRVELLEAITPIRRAAAVHAPFSPSIQQGVSAGQQFLRKQVASAFEPELEDLEEPRREQVLHMLTTVTAWPSWEMMRTLDGLDMDEARVVVGELVRAILDRAAAGPG